MQAVRVMGGNPFHILDLKLSATVVIGQPVLAGTGATPDGEITDPSSTTDYTDMAGLVLAASSFNPHGGGGGTLTYSTTQSDTEGLVRVVVNPNLIVSAKMSGGAAEGTALTTYTAAAAVSGGTSWVDADASTSMLEGTTWAIAPNNNIGQSRRVTTHATGSGTVTVAVPFNNGVLAADAFLLAPFLPMTSVGLTMTSLFTEARADVTVSGTEAVCLELILNGPSDSFVYWVPINHALNVGD